jgi:hypothetical protein
MLNPAVSTATMPNPPGERKAGAHQHNTALVASQPQQAGQPENQPSTHDKEGRLSPLSAVTFNPPGISTTQYANIKQAYGQMLDGYKSPGGSHINMDALMMVGFTAMQPSITAQSHFLMAKQQQQFMDEQNAIVRQSTAKLLTTQEELTNEAIKAKWLPWQGTVYTVP